MRNEQDKKVHSLTFKFTFEVEAGVSIYYAGIEHIDPTTGLVIL